MYGMRFYLRRQFVSLFVLMLSICSYAQNSSYLDHDIYIVGERAEDGVSGYWKNNEFTPLYSPVKHIVVENGNVYIGGSDRVYRHGTHESEVYFFINDSHDKRYLDNYEFKHKEVYTNSMAVCDGRVYIHGGGKYWGGNRASLDNLTGERFTYNGGPNITSYDGVLYKLTYSGYRAYGQEVQLEFKNNNKRSWYLNGIKVYYGFVLVPGAYKYPGLKLYPCYWLDGKLVELPKPSNNDVVTEDVVLLSSGNIYPLVFAKPDHSGDNRKHYFYAQGKFYEIPLATNIRKITVFEDIVYILGKCKRGALNIPCYWVYKEYNGVLIHEKHVTLPRARDAYDIFVTRD